ncbi:MAG TPA: low molecular weight phosphatase family protein [Thermoplasmata archaeon]|nr:low molecular weight phosphatase family protein [Thermoplasmata archaeon]
MVRIAFVCVENAGRSQMAAAFARREARDGVEVVSGGTRAASRVHPAVIEAMREVGIDLSGIVPRTITREEILRSDVVVTMGCASGDVCPATFRGDAVDWALPDPSGRSLEQVRRIRDDIEQRVTRLLREVIRGR